MAQSILEVGSHCTTPKARKEHRLEALRKLYCTKRDFEVRWISALKTGDCAPALRKESELVDEEFLSALKQYRLLYREEANSDLRDLDQMYSQFQATKSEIPPPEPR